MENVIMLTYLNNKLILMIVLSYLALFLFLTVAFDVNDLILVTRRPLLATRASEVDSLILGFFSVWVVRWRGTFPFVLSARGNCIFR
jgi:hypothetical protein